VAGGNDRRALRVVPRGGEVFVFEGWGCDRGREVLNMLRFYVCDGIGAAAGTSGEKNSWASAYRGCTV